MTEEDEAFNEIEQRSKVKQTLIVHKSKEAMLIAEVALLTEMVRVLSARVAKQEQGEPVAWHHPDGTPNQCTTDKLFAEMEPAWIPLYTTPPQRTWVGLTNNELQPIADEYRILFGGWVEDFAQAIEAKLKEKNINII